MLSLLKSRLFLAGQGFLALIVLVIILGRVFRLSWTVQLIAIIVIMVIGMIFLVVGYVRSNKSASAIQDSIRTQGEQQRMGVRPDNQAEIEQLQRDLEDAIERLKNSKLGGGKSGKAALYALPWYMIIGPPAAGKTTAIANSGLNFPIGMDAVRGVGGTRNCDWFFADSAIFLDTAGRYMTEHEDSEEWHKFLQTLKENRKRQPVNGIIVAISIDELADASVEQIEWHSSTIRKKIDDLVTRLDVTFPVYLIFTKCDLLRGFSQFFSALGRREREQVLGATLSRNWQDQSKLSELFEAEFDRIYGALVNWRNEGLSLAMKRDERHLVYVFPLEFASVRDKLSLFVTRLFQPNPYRETPLFRGFYFTSGTQEGLPIDRVIRAIAGRYGFAPASFEEGAPPSETKAYFIKEIFEKVIIPDRYIVSKTSKAAVRQRFVKAGIGTLSLVLLGLFVIGTFVGMMRSRSNLTEIRDASVAASKVQIRSTGLTEKDLTELESLDKKIADLQESSFFGWGLDKSANVQEPARKVLFAKLREHVAVHYFPRLEGRISAAVRSPSIDEFKKDELAENVKAYLLLTTESAQLDSTANSEFLKRHLISLADSISTESDARIRGLLPGFVDGIRDGSVDDFSQDSRLVTRAVQVLREPISPERLYARLRREGEQTLGEYSLSEISGPRSQLFETSPAISRFYTQDEWIAFVQARLTEFGAAPMRDAWVPWAVDAPDIDPQVLENQLTGLYFEDYTAAWERFLGKVRLAPFRDIRDAARKMETLADPDDSPLLWLLARVSTETTFGSQSLADIAQEASGVESRSDNPVERHFQALHQLNVLGAKSGTADDNLIQALNALKGIADELDARSSDNAEALFFAVDVLRNQGAALGEAQSIIRNVMSRQRPNIRENLFNAPVLLAWSAVLNSVQDNLNTRWRDEVYEPYRRTLEGRYPLGSSDDAPIADFEEFFRPVRGTVSRFYNEVLVDFLQENRLEPRRWQRRGIRISASSRAALQRTFTLQDVLYQGDVLRLAVDLEPEFPIGQASSYYLNIHGTTQTYDMGRSRTLEYSWPGRSPDVRLEVKTQDLDAPPIKFDGRWALFKFLSSAQKVPLSATEFELQWHINSNVTARYKAKMKSAINPLAQEDFFTIKIPSVLGG